MVSLGSDRTAVALREHEVTLAPQVPCALAVASLLFFVIAHQTTGHGVEGEVSLALTGLHRRQGEPTAVAGGAVAAPPTSAWPRLVFELLTASVAPRELLQLLSTHQVRGLGVPADA